jgi:hypothetical protein
LKSNYGELTQNDHKLKARRGKTRKFKNRDNAKLGGLVKEIGCQIVTQFMTLGTRKVPLQNSEE